MSKTALEPATEVGQEPPLEPEGPAHSALEGSLNYLEARLQARYGIVLRAGQGARRSPL